MNLAIGKLLDESGNRRLGTAFAVSSSLAITAFHCIGDLDSGNVDHPRVLLKFLTNQSVGAKDPTEGSYKTGCPELDYAILSLQPPLPASLIPLPLPTQVQSRCGGLPLLTKANSNEPFRCGGYPSMVHEADITFIAGSVREAEACIKQGIPAIQLFSPDAAAGLSLKGMSGAPVLVGKPEAAIGLVRWNPQQILNPELAVGGHFYACPVSFIIEKHPELLDSVKIITRGPRPFDPRIEPETVPIRAGPFLMGSPPGEGVPENETPQHMVTLPDYCIGRFPITHGQYERFIRANKHYEPPTNARWFNRKPPDSLRDHPVVGVSWEDAMAYCRWLSEKTGHRYRLPSEAQWEKAACWTAEADPIHAPETVKRIYPWGNKWVDGRCNVNSEGSTAVPAHPAGASAYGVQDLLGNVQEWTRSLWGRNTHEPEFGYKYDPEDGRELESSEEMLPQMRVVYRGGSYISQQDDVNNTHRGHAAPASKIRLGFRVVIEIE